MSATSHLLGALSAVDWNDLVLKFGSSPDLPARVEACNRRVALWAHQIELCEPSNAAIAFVRELQIQGYHAAALAALALYKPAASAMRALVESALYYTYFRVHPAELGTLVRDPKYFLQKSDVIEFHVQHTLSFRTREQKLGLMSRLDDWYSKVSAVVHGQIPGKWVRHTALSDVRHDDQMLEEVIGTFEDAARIVHELFLCTAGPELWSGFAYEVRVELLKGLSGDVKKILGLSAA